MNNLYYDAYRFGFASGLLVGMAIGAFLYWLIQKGVGDDDL